MKEVKYRILENEHGFFVQISGCRGFTTSVRRKTFPWIGFKDVTVQSEFWYTYRDAGTKIPLSFVTLEEAKK